jgi:hypothetical protein
VADLVAEVARHARAQRLLHGRGVDALRLAPRRDGALAHPDELVLVDDGVARVAVDRHARAVAAREEAVGHGDALGALDADGTDARQPPVAARWNTCYFEEKESKGEKRGHERRSELALVRSAGR